MKNLKKKWFTLIEILVAMTIFWLIMSSVMAVYISSTETNYESELNRSTHESIKNIIMDISEEITKSPIKWLYDWISNNCEPAILPENWKKIVTWSMFCSKNHIYFLAKKSWDNFLKEVPENCNKVDSECFIVKQETSWNNKPSPLTNSLVTVRKLNFLLTNNWSKKVTISVELQPSLNAWFKPKVAERGIFYLQTTFTEKQKD